jgi:hypothetical protein
MFGKFDGSPAHRDCRRLIAACKGGFPIDPATSIAFYFTGFPESSPRNSVCESGRENIG